MNAVETSTQSVSTTHEPRIVAFVCKWCTYAGADLAGTSRMTYPPNVKTLMLPCTGRIDVSFVIRAFLQGADGVIVSGCHPGDCHYTAGNFRARRRWALFRDLLDVLGVEMDRLQLAWISAAEGGKWVKMIGEFTDRIRKLGPYASMQKIATDHAPLPAPLAGSVNPLADDDAQPGPADPALVAAATDLLSTGKVKAVIGWRRNSTLGRARPAWITQASLAGEFCAPAGAANLARMLKNPMLHGVEPIGIVARMSEALALNVLVQEAQLNPASIQVLAVDPQGKFLGVMDLDSAGTKLVSEPIAALPEDRPVGFSDETLAALDDLMARPASERWAFWAEQSARCVKCFACRGSCPMCNCDQCVMDKNQPQWFPTAADGPGNFTWQIVRAFHLAGRCVGCGACQSACPAGIPLNVLSAAMARSAKKNFDYRAGLDAKAPPLQAAFKSDDPEGFIL